MDLHKLGILTKYRVEMIGAKPDALAKARTGSSFKQAMSRSAWTSHSRGRCARRRGEGGRGRDRAFPLIIRPSFTLGGQGGGSPTTGGVRPDRLERPRHFPVHEVLVEECLLG